MGWMESTGEAIQFIEKHITEDLTIDQIAKQVYLSPFYFQKGFAMLCGFTVGEYIRQRRLTLAGSELVSTDAKVIDIALKYGYESPDSFTKAFTRFHGVTPTAVRRDRAVLRSFAPLKLTFSLEGGYIMEYKIVEKEAFTVIGAARIFRYDSAFKEIPAFWDEHYQTGKGEVVCGMFGICIDKGMGSDNRRPLCSDEFEYLIADNYLPWKDTPDGFVAQTIPKHTWAVFPCRGAMPNSLQSVNQKIFSEWLPNCNDYEIAAGYNIEMYDKPTDYANGTHDEAYYSEIWIPVKKK